jgi:PAS domain S-box-containing protein
VPGDGAEGWIERALIQQSPACFWALDASGRFQYVSDNARPFFGKDPAELRGRVVDEVLPADQAQKWRGRIRHTIAQGYSVRRERIAGVLWGVVGYPLRAPGGTEVIAGGWAVDVTPIGTAEKELRDTTLRVLKAQESDRGRLARFLHDEVGQSLSAVGLQLDLLRMDFEGAVPDIRQRTMELQAMLETVMAGVRDFSYELNPDIVERAGLHAAMDRLVGRTRKRFSGNLRLLADSSLHVPPPVGSAIYKIAAEALENALQHSGCSQIELIIKSTPDGPALEVRDNGKGFDAVDLGGPHRGLGLLVMEHYAAQNHLRLSVVSERGKGTTVRAVFENGSEESRG